MSRKDTIQQIEKMQAEANGKLFVGFVHQIYGPLRGLNFILTDANPEKVVDFIDDAQKPNKMKVIEKKMKEAKKGLPPKDIRDIITQIWTESSLATLPMILPFEMVEEAEKKPLEVATIDEGILVVHNKLKENQIQSVKDFFFYRTGIF